MSGFRLGRFGGITVRADMSWLVIVVLVVASMVGRVVSLYDVAAPAAVAIGVAATVVFFACLLAHELAHAAVAVRLGIEVQDITLFLFGGATRTKGEHRSPREELLVTAAGPATSLLLAAAFWAVVVVAGSADGAVVGTVGYLAWVNLALGLFNLAPAYPLDGGRLLRSLLWRLSGDRDRATRQAAGLSQLVAWGLISLGLLSVVGGGLSGLWIALIGWFLLQSARGEELRLQLRRELEDVPAHRVMRAAPLVLGEDLTVREALAETRRAPERPAYPVVDELGDYVGVVTHDELDELLPRQGDELSIAEVVHRIPDGVVADVEASMGSVLEHLDGPDAEVVIVAGPHRRVVGVVTADELLQWARHRA